MRPLQIARRSIRPSKSDSVNDLWLRHMMNALEYNLDLEPLQGSVDRIEMWGRRETRWGCFIRDASR